MLKGKKVAYAKIVYTIQLQKAETHRIRMTIEGNLLNYDGNIKALTVDLVTMKLLLNSVLSTPGAKFMTINIKNFYLETDLKDKQYIFLLAELVPEEIMLKYNLYSKVHNSNIYI